MKWLEGVEWRLEASDPLKETWKPTIISLLTEEAKEIAKEIKKVSEALTYDGFRQLLIAKMNDENTKARINMELSMMAYTKNTDIDEYVMKMVTLLRAKTPGIREAAVCERIMDRLPAWAQNGIRTCGVTDSIKELKTHMMFTNRAQQRMEEELDKLRNQMETRKALGKINRVDHRIPSTFEKFKKKFENKTRLEGDKKVVGDGNSSEPICFNCRRSGYFANSCKEKKRVENRKAIPERKEIKNVEITERLEENPEETEDEFEEILCNSVCVTNHKENHLRWRRLEKQKKAKSCFRKLYRKRLEETVEKKNCGVNMAMAEKNTIQELMNIEDSFFEEGELK